MLTLRWRYSAGIVLFNTMTSPWMCSSKGDFVLVQGTLPFVSVGGVPFVLILASTLRVAPVLRKMYRELALFRFAGKEGVDTLEQRKKEVVKRLQRPGQYQPHRVPGWPVASVSGGRPVKAEPCLQRQMFLRLAVGRRPDLNPIRKLFPG